jgi:OTU domain-containing protein 6
MFAQALSELLRTGIVVHAADFPVVEMGTAASSAVAPPLRVSFHRHYYTLGAHYNSVVPATPVESDEQ